MNPPGTTASFRPAAAGGDRPADLRRQLGRRGENLAAGHLERLGLRLLARNVRTRFGEIDLIAFDGKTIVFVEVKTLRGTQAELAGCPATAHTRPLAWLSPRQCARLRRLACAWLNDADSERPRAQAIRFDAIGVVLGAGGELLSLEHLEAAW